MYIKFATEEDICKALAKYKKGDHVVTLKEIRNKNGIIEANTELQITDVRIPKDVFLPLDIPQSRLTKYVVPYDEYTFTYTLIPLDHYYNGTAFELDSSNFEYADQAMPNTYAAKRKNKKKANRLYQLKIGGPFIGCMFLLAIAFCGMIAMPTSMSEINYFLYTFLSIGLSIVTAGIAVLALATVGYLISGDRHENRIRKYVFGHLIRKKD